MCFINFVRVTMQVQGLWSTVHVLNFVGKIFVFGWQEDSWGINFRGHGSMVGTIIV